MALKNIALQTQNVGLTYSYSITTSGSSERGGIYRRYRWLYCCRYWR